MPGLEQKNGVEDSRESAARPMVLSLSIKERSTLYKTYIPGLKNGGLFVPTTKPFQFGDEVFMILNIMNDPDKIPVAGKIVWITPENCPTGKVAGIGVHFNAGEAAETAKAKIEAALGGLMNASRPTYTL